MAYSDKVIDHYENPRNVGSLPKDDANVGTGLVGAPECGDVMKLQVKVNPDTGVIDDAKFKTFGCGSAIASSSLATEWLKGKTVDQALAIKNTDIVAELSLPPVKIHCSVLAEDAIKAAIADYKKKQDERRASSPRRSTRSRRVTATSQFVAARTEADDMNDMIEISATRGAEDQVADGQAGHRRWRSSCGRQGRRMLGPELHVRLGDASRASATRSSKAPRREDFVDKKSYLFLNGTTLDYDTALLTQGFVFHNPNAKRPAAAVVRSARDAARQRTAVAARHSDDVAEPLRASVSRHVRSMLECRSCGAGAPVDEHFCPQCSRILSLGRHGDYFAFLGLPRRLCIDPGRARAALPRPEPASFIPTTTTTRRRPSGWPASSARRISTTRIGR